MIRRFLLAFKKAVSQGNWEILQRRAIYASSLELNITQIKILLLQLTPDEYFSGPTIDRNRRTELLWVFHKDADSGTYFYIKLKLVAGHAKVISFHKTIY